MGTRERDDSRTWREVAKYMRTLERGNVGAEVDESLRGGKRGFLCFRDSQGMIEVRFCLLPASRIDPPRRLL